MIDFRRVWTSTKVININSFGVFLQIVFSDIRHEKIF